MTKKVLMLTLILLCSSIAFAACPAGMVSYWKLENLTGDVIDECGFNDGNNWGPDRGVDGQVGNSFYFDHVELDHVRISDSSSLDITDEITVEAWVNLSNTIANYQYIVDKGNSYSLSYFGNYIYFTVYGPAPQATSVNVDSSVLLDKWNHLAATFNGSVKKIYLNGDEIKSHTVSSNPITPTNNDLFFGRLFNNQAQSWNGNIDEVAIWDTALGSAEIEQHFLNGNNSGLGYDEQAQQGEGSTPELSTVSISLTLVLLVAILAVLFVKKN